MSSRISIHDLSREAQLVTVVERIGSALLRNYPAAAANIEERIEKLLERIYLLLSFAEKPKAENKNAASAMTQSQIEKYARDEVLALERDVISATENSPESDRKKHPWRYN